MSIFEEESTEPFEKQAWRIADNSSCGDNLSLINSIAEALADAAAPRLGLIEQNHHFAAQIEGFTRENEGLRKERDKLVRILKIVEQYVSGPPSGKTPDA